ncbi:Putative ribosome-binding factor A, mitochondrial [Dufourea novaeangliae]|uniref:Putative ribosome-binding factor A, mitochondrial n=1 Tax=Dufourea novaeangliae TaxID=178035 RepID=A0A154PFY6_DUFNO|nr:Putative ribosome-binding factor A, mitochondrial [Dufourea novaeangliae]
MNKILRRNDQGKIQMDGYTLSEIPKKTISKHTHRRMTVLNKVFMKHITDFMCTGEIDLGLMNKSVEIHDVKVTQDFKLVNIYWSDNSLDTSDTEEILKRCAFQLRYELTQLHVIGRVPPIQFVRYKHIHAQNEVDRRLAIADYGEDYIPSVYPLATNCVVTFSNSVNTDEKSLESKNTDNSNSNFSVTLPIMRHDVFGLNHARIMSKIKASLNQAKQVHWKENNNQLNPTPTSESSSQSMPSFLTTEEQQEQFNNYLREKQRQRRLKRNNSRTNIHVPNLDHMTHAVHQTA